MWGRAKLGPLLRREGFLVSDATAGRILAHLVARGVVVPVPQARTAAKTRRWTAARHPAVRLPKGLKASKPGGLVQIDTVFVQTGPSATSSTSTPTARSPNGPSPRPSAAAFLDKVQAAMPFPVKTIQIDGGSEFRGEFEKTCAEKGVVLYEPPPKRPQLNGAVERCNAAWRYEFYAVYDLPSRLDQLNEHIDSLSPSLQTPQTQRSPCRTNPGTVFQTSNQRGAPVSYLLNPQGHRI